MLTITAKKETTVRKLTTEKRTPPEVVIANFLEFPLFSQQKIGHPKHADQNFSRDSGYRKVHTNNVWQQEDPVDYRSFHAHDYNVLNSIVN